ncbi:MAG: rane fusion protein YbhG [Candidatus Binatota bacterium]|jgi:HlyD family secretion protein|nr:rane fusion protein YbhG [Candidatus Binatota bacterium]
MKRKAGLAALVAVAVVAVAVFLLRRDREPRHYTGFVEGEERVLRSEVTGRVLEVRFGEGDRLEPGEVVARLDDRELVAKIASQRQELDVLEAELAAQQERIDLTDATWRRDVGARRADVDQVAATAALAERSFAREAKLVATGASTSERLDDVRARRDEARSVLAGTRERLERALAEERTIALARRELETVKARRGLARARLAELEVVHAKYEIHAPGVATRVQTQFLWPGELAQPGTAVAAVLDPTDKYVQIYLPVAELDAVRIGQRVEIELDSRPGSRFSGEVSFIADEANFTPEKIETRGDRLGQVYRAKVRILEGVEELNPGTEGNVYLEDHERGGARPAPVRD